MADPRCVRRAWLVLGANSVELDNPAGGWFCESFDLGYPAVRDVVTNRPDQDGADDTTAYMGPRVVSADITAIAGAGARIDAVATSFAPFMVPSTRPALHYVLDRPGAAERVITVRPSGYSWAVVGAQTRSIQLQFVAPDPAVLDPTVKTVSCVTNNLNVSMANLGDLPTRPTLRVDGPVTQPVILLGASYQFNVTFLSGGVLGAGQWLNIDTVNHTVLLNGTTPWYQYLDWANTKWPVLPPNVNTQMAMQGQAASWVNGTTKLTATWQDRYLI